MFFVTGNHDLWLRKNEPGNCIDKFSQLQQRLSAQGVLQQPEQVGEAYVVPLQSWYDYSFGQPGRRLRLAWMDFHRCRWPEHWEMKDVAEWFQSQNQPIRVPPTAQRVITFSHFMPRADLLPQRAVEHAGFLLPILGAAAIDGQLRRLGSSLHVYGHSHVNVDTTIDSVRYLNNALGYPAEPGHHRR